MARPDIAAWKACAVPWNLVVTLGGRMPAPASFTSLTASPSETPGLRLNEIVTAGSWPRWLTDSGPTVALRLATAFSGTSAPDDERTYSRDRAAGSVWSFGRSCRITWYSLLGA